VLCTTANLAANDRCGSSPGIIAPHQQCPVHLDQQTYQERPGDDIVEEAVRLIALVAERIDEFGTERQLGKSLQPIETKWADLAPVGKKAA
jgi:hypothetical protein